MGYDTEFYGKFALDKPLSEEDYKELREFTYERHEDKDFPSYYCQWVPSKDGRFLQWDGGEKFYEYEHWLVYLIKKFFIPKGYVLNGEVKWKGDEYTDVGVLRVTNNEVEVKQGKIIYE